jgi:LCP family protein required for cell wall assembly
VRLNSNERAITVTSIPRDLMVDIPGHGRSRINDAFALGGVNLTLKTVKRLLSTPERPFRVNHVMVTSFGDFRRAIDYLDCAYVDIDRDYYNQNTGPGGFAAIDIDPGYQKLCGSDALDYVRFRHNDNDLVRAARQQDFVRQLKSQTAVQELLKWDGRTEVAKMAGRYLETNKQLRKKKDLFRILKLVIVNRDKTIQQVPFRAVPSADNANVLEASDSMLEATMDDFFHPPTKRRTPTATKRRQATKKRKLSDSELRGLENARREGEDMAVLNAKRVKFPFYFPQYKTTGARYVHQSPHIYGIRDENGKLRRAYRLVLHKAGGGTLLTGEYYGVQGISWRYPPILDNPSEYRTVNGRRLMLFYDGRRLRLVAWRTPNASYWVSNTLTKSLSEREMLAIAGSLRRLG